MDLEVASKRGVLDNRLLRIPRGGVQTPLLDHGTLRFADPERGGGGLQHDADIKTSIYFRILTPLYYSASPTRRIGA